MQVPTADHTHNLFFFVCLKWPRTSRSSWPTFILVICHGLRPAESQKCEVLYLPTAYEHDFSF